MSENTQSSGLFSVFIISIYSLVLIPYSVYKLCCSADTTTVQPWTQKGKKKGGASEVFKKYFTKVMLVWVQYSVKEMKPFDPFEIMGLERAATPADIKKAYRNLSLKYHPDKNPDPAAQAFYRDFITKAYQALTDDVARQNYEKYGHPDGPQAMNIGVALPNWMFSRENPKAKALMLLALIGGGVMLPLLIASYYMLNSQKLAGPNAIQAETLMIFLHSKWNVKESQSLVRIPETLVCAVEFINLNTPAEHMAPIDELRKAILRTYPDLKDKSIWWKRKASVLKVHMLLLAYLDRDQASIPAALKQDLLFVLQKSPLLLDEMLKIANVPRPPYGYGWLTPSVACIEMQQCLTQALSLGDRKGKIDPSTVLLQLPNFDQEVLKKLKRRKVQAIKDLIDMSEFERNEALASSGLLKHHIDQVNTYLAALPSVHALVTLETDADDEIMEQDVCKAKVRVIVTRPTHKLPSFEPPVKGKAIQAYAPSYPHTREEQWYVLLADAANNSVLAWTKVSLSEAEAIGYARPELAEEWAALDKGEAATGKDGKPAPGKAAATATKFIRSYQQQQRPNGSVGTGLDGVAADSSVQEAGQLVELMFAAPPKAGKYDLCVMVMSDSYVGVDKSVPVRLRVSAMTRAALEEREARAEAKIKEEMEGEKEQDADRDSDAGSGSGSDDEDDDYEYDSDETGELESGSESEAEEEGANKASGSKAIKHHQD